MPFDLYHIKKWIKMLTGKSLLHVEQNVGSFFSVSEIKGYYNDLTQKVLKDEIHVEDENYLPICLMENGENIEFSIAIFQYGLGCYDLYLQTTDELYLNKFLTTANWALTHQGKKGEFDTFSYVYFDSPYSAMSQGEGASVLLRAYVATGELKYLEAAKKAIDFMLLSVEDGGTTIYEQEKVFLLEYTHLPVVMNGWIFALFGLFDLTIVCKEEKYKAVYVRSVKTLMSELPKFDCKYWTMYDAKDKIASPFYHNLHIAQMQALKRITGENLFEEYEFKWRKYQKNPWKKMRAFIKKARQKIFEK